MLPSLKPADNQSEQQIMTGTDPVSIPLSSATENATLAIAYESDDDRKSNDTNSDRGGTRTLDQRINVPHRLSPTIATSMATTRLLALAEDSS